MSGNVNPRPATDFLPRDTFRLGFGCAELPGRLSRPEACRLLEGVLDAGINYFDTARMYGSGLAEGILGDFLQRHRNRVVVVSKAGILPPARSVFVRATRKGVRLAHLLAPGLKPHLPVPAFTQPRFNVFDTSALRSSIETSLRELRTDRIDILLLHEITVGDAARPELLGFLNGLVREGKIGAFGLATSFDETSRIVSASPGLTNVVQFPSSAWDRNIEKLPKLPDSLLVTHSCLGRRFHALRERLSVDGDMRERFKRAVGFDLSDAGTLARICLAHALWSNPDGIVLFSSFKPANIQANAALVRGTPMDAQVLSNFARLLSEAEQSRLAA